MPLTAGWRQFRSGPGQFFQGARTLRASTSQDEQALRAASSTRCFVANGPLLCEKNLFSGSFSKMASLNRPTRNQLKWISFVRISCEAEVTVCFNCALVYPLKENHHSILTVKNLFNQSNIVTSVSFVLTWLFSIKLHSLH